MNRILNLIKNKMEFEFDCEEILRIDQDGFTIIDGARPQLYMKQVGGGINAHRTSSFFNQGKVDKNSSPEEKLTDIIDKMG